MRTPSKRPGLQRPGESTPHRLNWLTYLLALPSLVEPLTNRVPDTHVRFEEHVAAVTCICNGGLPILIEPARSKECKCGRIFVNIGGEVRVFREAEAA